VALIEFSFNGSYLESVMIGIKISRALNVKGISLPELVMSIGIGSITMLALGTMFHFTMKQTVRSEKKNSISSDMVFLQSIVTHTERCTNSFANLGFNPAGLPILIPANRFPGIVIDPVPQMGKVALSQIALTRVLSSYVSSVSNAGLPNEQIQRINYMVEMQMTFVEGGLTLADLSQRAPLKLTQNLNLELRVNPITNTVIDCGNVGPQSPQELCNSMNGVFNGTRCIIGGNPCSVFTTANANGLCGNFGTGACGGNQYVKGYDNLGNPICNNMVAANCGGGVLYDFGPAGSRCIPVPAPPVDGYNSTQALGRLIPLNLLIHTETWADYSPHVPYNIGGKACDNVGRTYFHYVETGHPNAMAWHCEAVSYPGGTL
jgi:hypothetical protein